MKKTKTFLRDLGFTIGAMLLALAAILGVDCLDNWNLHAQSVASGPSSISQASGAVFPRQWLIWNGVLTPNQQLTNGTNANMGALTNLLGTNVASYQWLATNSAYFLAPTYMTPALSHAISLIAMINETNVMAHASNMAVVVYPCYDLQGPSSGVGQRIGTIIGTNDPFTWTIAYQTNGVYVTNIPSSFWDGATALAYTITNGINSNVDLVLIQGSTP